MRTLGSRNHVSTSGARLQEREAPGCVQSTVGGVSGAAGPAGETPELHAVAKSDEARASERIESGNKLHDKQCQGDFNVTSMRGRLTREPPRSAK